MKPFEACRFRVERAKAHYVILSELWNKIPAEDLYAVGANVNTDGAGVIRLTRTKPLSQVFALQFGEMLYQLRAALDGAIYTAAVLETGNDPPRMSKTWNSRSSMIPFGTASARPTCLAHSPMFNRGSSSQYSHTVLRISLQVKWPQTSTETSAF